METIICQIVGLFILVYFFLFFYIQQYKYRDLTVREITNVISQYKDLKPVMDAYGKILSSYLHFLDLFFEFFMSNWCFFHSL